jgi:phenylpropionate dioxygenase-like ring-hydroxylating dioxygenase large terminal subunit
MYAKPLTWSLPAKTYCDPETHKRERAKIFTANWSLFTWASRIELPGTYVTGTLAGYPIVVLRDKSGVLRGFHNVCRHRGAMLLQGEGVCGHVITCPYHAWTYHDDGRLLKATEFGDAPDFDAQEWALRAVDVEAWRGLVFVRITRGGPGLVNWLGPIVDMAAGYDLESQRFFMKKEREVAIDWKAYAENYLECYHCRMMHPGLCDSLDINRYTVDVHREDWFFHLHAPKREGGLTRGLYFYRFPYLMLNLYDWGSSIATVEPLGPGRVRHINWYLFKDISPERAEDNRASAEWSAQIVTEDLAMVEGVQRNLEAGIYERGPLSPRWEHGVAAFHDMVREVLDPPPAVKSVAA